MQGLAAVREHRPDAVITDLDMPRMTGLQLCREIRQDPELKHIPVIVVSGSLDSYDSHTLAAGVTAIVPKPFVASDAAAPTSPRSWRNPYGSPSKNSDPVGDRADPAVDPLPCNGRSAGCCRTPSRRTPGSVSRSPCGCVFVVPGC